MIYGKEIWQFIKMLLLLLLSIIRKMQLSIVKSKQKNNCFILIYRCWFITDFYQNSNCVVCILYDFGRYSTACICLPDDEKQEYWKYFLLILIPCSSFLMQLLLLLLLPPLLFLSSSCLSTNGGLSLFQLFSTSYTAFCFFHFQFIDFL